MTKETKFTVPEEKIDTKEKLLEIREKKAFFCAEKFKKKLLNFLCACSD